MNGCRSGTNLALTLSYLTRRRATEPGAMAFRSARAVTAQVGLHSAASKQLLFEFGCGRRIACGILIELARFSAGA
jgi:hypothetical protein